MKAFLRDKNSFVAVSPTPTVDVEDGLTIYLNKPMQEHLEPRMTGDLKAGVMRYDIPEGLRSNVERVEINGK